MRVLIVSGGELGDPEWINRNLPNYDYMICADGGARHLRLLDLKPDLLLGDFDSISENTLEFYRKAEIPIITYPTDKDKTDTQIAVDLAMERGATDVYLLGALGSRWDHSFANVMLLYRLENNGIRARIIHSNNIIMLSNQDFEVNGDIGQTVSLLPFGGEVYISSTEGLKYPIYNKILPQDFPIGVSNVLIDTKAVVRIKSGWVMVILARD